MSKYMSRLGTRWIHQWIDRLMRWRGKEGQGEEFKFRPWNSRPSCKYLHFTNFNQNLCISIRFWSRCLWSKFDFQIRSMDRSLFQCAAVRTHRGERYEVKLLQPYEILSQAFLCLSWSPWFSVDASLRISIKSLTCHHRHCIGGKLRTNSQ